MIENTFLLLLWVAIICACFAVGEGCCRAVEWMLDAVARLRS